MQDIDHQVLPFDPSSLAVRRSRPWSGRRYLVTGGAGFVGSHVVQALTERGDTVVVLDDLSQGHRESLPLGVALHVASVADMRVVNKLLAAGPWDAVLHFAARSLVGESMQQPLRYLMDNGTQGIALVDACIRQGVKRFVLSSTANLYGNPQVVPIPEEAPIVPHSPYGESKLVIERALHWASEIHGLRYASLRYFNAAGSDPNGRLGEDHDPETHIIPLVIDAVLGRRQEFAVFGRDWPTPDGTCIRDYVHVNDLADAHLRALDAIDAGSVTWNVGNGAGFSVLDVVRAVERVSGQTVPLREAARRLGDPAVLVAQATRIRAETGWNPRFESLEDVVATAWEWRRRHPDGYGSRKLDKLAAESSDTRVVAGN